VHKPLSRRRAVTSLHRKLLLFFSLALLISIIPLGNFLKVVPTAQAVSSNIVISQVYGGAGCGTAGCSTYKNDYIELFNRGASPVSLNGWSVQYAAAAGTSWQTTALTNVTLQPGQYYLVAEGAGANGVNNIPTADATGSIAMSATAAKVALVNTTTALSGSCPASASIVDLIGYGATASCFETAVASAPSTTTADVRGSNGCTETDNNSTDFTATTPNPRNTATALNVCGGGPTPTPTPSLSINDVTQAEGDAGTTNFNFTVSLSTPAQTGGVSFTVNTADGTATAPSDYTAIVNGAGSIPEGSSSTQVTVSVNGDTTTESNETFLVNISNVTGAGVTDGQGQGTITNDDFTGTTGQVVISQAYGGGGNSGSTYTNDYVELHNNGTSAVDITNWSVQYSTNGTTTWTPTPLCPTGTCSIPAGGYFLVKESAGTGGTTALPTPDVTGSIAMGATSARVALVNNTNALSGACPTGPSIIDFVGYGGSATCFEGTGPTPTLSNLLSATRKKDGCQDTNNNSSDFFADGPIPRNSSWPVQTCGGDPTQLFAYGIAKPASVDPAATTVLTVTVTPATSPNVSTGIAVQANLSSIGGSATQQFYDDGTHGDVTASDNVFSFSTSAVVGTATGSKSMLATVTDAQSRSFTSPITLTVQSPTCGVERWSVKTGTDPDAHLVDLNNATPTTIADMRGWPTPGTIPDNARIAPYETTVWVVDGTLTLYKLETDVDYHIVLQDNSGNTIVTEIPLPGCVGPSSPFAAAIAHARAQFDARLTATTSFQSANIPVRVTGVGMFDFIHGQTGVAPNGIELHPIIDIVFKSTPTATVTSTPNPSQYGQSVTFTATVASASGPTPTGTVTFLDGANTLGTGNLDGSGNATLQTSNLAVGQHTITAQYGGDSNYFSTTSPGYIHNVTKADQTITFNALSDKTYGDADFNVSASASSGLPVTFGAVGNCTVSGNTVHITGAGSCTITASQAGDSNYNAAPDVARSFNIAKATPVITWSNPADIIYGTALSGTQLNATANVPGSFVYTPASGTVLGYGSHNLHVDFTPSDTANYDNASKDVSINVLSAVLNISMIADRNPAVVELNFNYKATITNTGNASSTNTVLVDVLPTGVNFTAATSTQGTCTYAAATRTVTCNLGTIAAGSSVNVQITVKPTQEGTLNDTASITASQWDPATGNSSASVNGLPAIKQTDLSVQMTNAPDPIFVSQTTTYTMVVKNNSTVIGASGVALTDSLPASLKFVSATTSQGSLVTPPVGSTGIVTANLGSLGIGATATVTVTVSASASGLVTNTATVSGNEQDPNSANNTDSTTTTVKDAALQKVLLVKQVLIGGCENTTGNVYLTGPAPAGGLTVSLSTSSLAGVTVPASVFIPAGQSVSPAFNVTTTPVVTKQVGLVNATLGASTVSRGLTINVGSGTCPP
jgi:uncharacterized repeat protein (TIGR01451 family)